MIKTAPAPDSFDGGHSSQLLVVYFDFGILYYLPYLNDLAD